MCDQLLCTNMDDVILCTLSPNHNIHEEKGVYQRRTMYALKSKSVLEMHFPATRRSKFADSSNSKKTKSLGKNGYRQKCLDKSLNRYILYYKRTSLTKFLTTFKQLFKTCTHEKIQGETAFTVTVKLVNGKDVLLP